MIALSPALSAAISGHRPPDQNKVSLRILGSIGSFTPVTRDERLAKAYADAARESQNRSFRFTPASGSASGDRSLTVLVRAGGDDPAVKHGQTANLGLAPVAYSLGKAKGLDGFAVGGVDAPKEPKELSPITESVQMPSANFALQQQSKPSRFSTNLQLESRAVTATAPTNSASLGQEKSYTVDLSSSYALTRHLDVQAGLRYRGPENRLSPALTDQAQDSQAVYVGTKFKF